LSVLYQAISLFVSHTCSEALLYGNYSVFFFVVVVKLLNT
jgi:hypothetical protein